LKRGGALFVLKRKHLKNSPMNKQASINILKEYFDILFIYFSDLSDKYLSEK